MTSLKDLIWMHIRADCPCTFTSIMLWVKEQFNGPVPQDYQIAMELTELIREGNVEIGDDGKSFTMSDSPKRSCTSFGADPDLKPGPLTQEDRGWQPN